MPNTNRLEQLLARWRHLRDSGRPVRAEDLCRDDPDLLPELRRWIERQAPPGPVPDATRVTESGQMPAEPTVSPAGVAPGTSPDLSFLAPARGPGELGWLGGYRVLRPLGAGGMGMVLLGEDVGLQRPVALKVMLPRIAADPVAKGRFLREARAAAQVQHDGVVTIYQVGEADGCPFIAMELLRGVPLDRWLDRNPPPDVPFILRVGREAAEALAAAHAQGLVHRDVKPANLWLEAPNGRVKILDFGLARPADRDAHLTGSGVVVGTPAYMAPEQARGLVVGPGADLFSLGCVLYRLCTGSPPFRGDSTLAVLTALAVDAPAPIRPHNPAVPPALESLVLRLLEKDPGRRPTSAAAVAQALRRIESEGAAPSVAPSAMPAEHNPWEELTEIADPPAAEPVEPAAELARPRRSRKPLLLAGLAGAALVAAVAAALLARPAKGTVRVESPEPGVPVVLVAEDGAEAVVGEAEARLPAGRYRVRLGEGVTGLVPAADEVTLPAGGHAVVELSRVAARVSPRPRPPALKRGPADDVWVKQVQGLTGEERAQAVIAKLRELNPRFKFQRQELSGEGVDFLGVDGATNLTPLRAVPELTRLTCASAELSDLAPLAGLKLRDFNAAATPVTDLSVLRGMPLEYVNLDNTPVTDLSPVAVPTLKILHVCGCPRLTDLSPLEGCPLERLVCHLSTVRDLTVCRDLPLNYLAYDYRPGDYVEPIRGHKGLKQIGRDRPVSAAEFWKGVDEYKAAFENWVRDTAALPADRQARAVAEKLAEHNLGFAGKLEPLVEGGVVTRLTVTEPGPLFDLSPLRALTGLYRLDVLGKPGETQVGHLEPLAGLKRLRQLALTGCPVRDLGPLRGLRLEVASFADTDVESLEPLRDHPLQSVSVTGSRVRDLAPLRGKALHSLRFSRTPVEDIGPLRGMPLRHLELDYWPQRGDRELLGVIQTLETINGRPAADFFKDADAFEAWVKATSALKPREQITAVVARLKELNGNFEYNASGEAIEGDAVTGFKFSAVPLQDLRPLRALPKLKVLELREFGHLPPTPPLDLRPLAGLRLTQLLVVSDRLVDLSPLKGMPLEVFCTPSTAVEDLSPLKGMPLTNLNVPGRRLRDLAPLAGAPLTDLHIPGTAVADLSPVKDAPIGVLNCLGTRVTDFEPCAKMPLRAIAFDIYPGLSHVEPLRRVKTLTEINGRPAAEFWKAFLKNETAGPSPR